MKIKKLKDHKKLDAILHEIFIFKSNLLSKFFHDISGPVQSSQFCLDILPANMSNYQQLSDNQISAFNLFISSTNRLKDIIKFFRTTFCYPTNVLKENKNEASLDIINFLSHRKILLNWSDVASNDIQLNSLIKHLIYNFILLITSVSNKIYDINIDLHDINQDKIGCYLKASIENHEIVARHNTWKSLLFCMEYGIDNIKISHESAHSLYIFLLLEEMKYKIDIKLNPKNIEITLT